MLKKNDQITVDIERFGAECGIAHLDGMTLFVLGALPGEKVVARVQKVEKKYAFLKTLEERHISATIRREITDVSAALTEKLMFEAGADFSDGLTLPGVHFAPDERQNAVRVEAQDANSLQNWEKLARALELDI